MERRELSTAFQLLDSKDIRVVTDFVNSLKPYERDSWVVESLITYYMSTQSQKAAELIVKSHNDHDKVVFRKLHSTYEDLHSRKSTVKLLLYIVSRKPVWLYKIVQEPLFKDVIRCMKQENQVPLLLDAVYIVTMLLPVIPDGMVKYFDDMFEALLRITHFSFVNKDGVPDVYLLHLNVGVYAMFTRLYGMYPWHYISALQDLYSKHKLSPDFFNKAIKPMLSTIKFNPGLVTTSKDAEYRGDQWKSKATHDIVAECASLSLDATESSQDYPSKPSAASLTEQVSIEEDTIQDNIPLSDEIAAPLEMAKDSLISVAANSSTFFSPSDRLGLSTPPPVDPMTPSSIVTNTTTFTFVTPNNGTPQSNIGQTKTPQNTSHNTPTQYTPKNTPTTPLIESGGGLCRSRHTSGTKRSLSGISTEGSIPPSPLRKEFTSEPPTDIPKITSVGSENSSVNTTTTLSVSNLPHLLEKISDTGSTHDTDTSNNSEDEEVESINTQPPDMQTVNSVAEFMKSVNRIRFTSMTQPENEADKISKGKLKRSGSCPTFTEDIHEESHDNDDVSTERCASIQTASSNGKSESKSPLSAAKTDQPDVASADFVGHSTATLTTPSVSVTLSHKLPADLADLHSVYSQPLSSSGFQCSQTQVVQGPASALDQHLALLNEKLRLGSTLQIQLQESGSVPNPSVNWSHFGGLPATDDASIARVQLLLLHTQLLYERQKKELHAERNRRLLSKIAKAQKIKENNQTLEWELSRSKDDIFNLQTTIRLQNNEIHRMREEKTRNDTIREQELAELTKMKERLEYKNAELKREFTATTEQFTQKQEELAKSIGKVELLEQDLQVAAAEICQYKRYEGEVSRMKKELLMMGEIQIKYEEKLSSQKYDNHLIAANSAEESDYLSDIAKLKETIQKLTEECHVKQSTVEVLNSKLKDKEKIIFEQQREMQCLRGEHKCKLQAVEDKYIMAQSALQTLEMQIFSLYDKIGRLNTPTHEKPRSSYSSSHHSKFDTTDSGGNAKSATAVTTDTALSNTDAKSTTSP